MIRGGMEGVGCEANISISISTWACL